IAELFRKFLVDDEYEIDGAVAYSSFRFRRSRHDLNTTLLRKPVHQDWCVFAANDGNLDLLRRLVLPRELAEHEPHNERTEQGAEEERVEGAAVTKAIDPLLARDDPNL